MDLNQLSNNPEQIKQLIDILQKLLPQTEEVSSEQLGEPEKATPVEFQKSFKNNRKNQYGMDRNKFEDMPEKNMHKEDSLVDKQLTKHPPVARAREFEPIKVTCRVCGKTDTLNPSLVESSTRYKCNRCAASAG